MFCRLISTFGIFFAVSALVDAHAIVEPVLGVLGTPVRNDVKRPSTAAPCGQKVDIASSLENSNAITARRDGSFVATALNFNGGRDGSRFFSAMVDPTGLGATFVNATVVQNGDLEPKTNAPQDLVVQLPASLKCSGGSSGDLCLVSFKQVAGFGNCVVVRHQGTIELQTSTVSGATQVSATPKGTASFSSSKASITSSATVSAKQGKATGASSTSARSSPSDEAAPEVTITVTHTIHTSTITRTAFTSTSTIFDATSSSGKAASTTARPEGGESQSVSFGSLTSHLTVKTGDAEPTKKKIRPSFTLINPSLTVSEKEASVTGTSTNGLFVPTGSMSITFSTPKPASRRRLNFDFSLHGLRSRTLKQRLPLEH